MSKLITANQSRVVVQQREFRGIWRHQTTTVDKPFQRSGFPCSLAVKLPLDTFLKGELEVFFIPISKQL
jgi:hypothetical protein